MVMARDKLRPTAFKGVGVDEGGRDPCSCLVEGYNEVERHIISEIGRLVASFECDIAEREYAGVGLAEGLAFEDSAGLGAVSSCADYLLAVAA